MKLLWVGGGILALMAAGGCSREYYRKDADREVYTIIDRKRAAIPQLTGALQLQDLPEDPLAGLPRVPTSQPAEPAAGQAFLRRETPTSRPSAAVQISLTDALELAARNNRDYQREKEDVYLAALDLTLERYRFDPIFAARLGGNHNASPAVFTDNPRPGARVAREVFRNVVAGAVEPLVGTGAAGAIGQNQVVRSNIHHDQQVSADSDVGVNELLAGGGTVVLNIASQVLRHLTGDPRRAAASILTLDFVQPMLRGAGRKIVQENLTQAERDVLYQLRTFARFRQTFSVSVATQYYRLLQSSDSLHNALENYRQLVVARQRTEMMAKAARLPEFQVDQARQDELEARDRWVRARQRFEESLDGFKITLGIPTEVPIVLCPQELDRLREAGIRHPEMDLNTASRLALMARLDLTNLADQVDDGARQIDVAADALRADLGFTANIEVDTAGPTQLTKFRLDRASYDLGIDLDLPVDRKTERNVFRRSIIEWQRRKRAFTLARDNITLAVRNAYRDLQQARESLEIQQRSRELAERRVESTTVLLQAGRADTRDLLEAQRALLSAQNGVTQALIDHTIARLNFYRDVGILQVTSAGLLKEPEDFATGPD